MAVRNVRPPREDDDNPRLEDVEQFNDATRACPKCASVLHDDVELCWKCGYAVNAREDKGLPTWALWVISILLVAIVLRFVI